MDFEFDFLIEKILDRQVVPFISNELCFVKDLITQEEVSIEVFLARECAKVLRIEFEDEKLSELARMAIKQGKAIHRELRNIYQKIGVKGTRYENYKFLDKNFERLAEIEGFKTFISISFTDLLQKKLIERWGEDNVIIIDHSLSSVSNLSIHSLEISEDTVVVINLLGSILGNNEFAISEEEHLEYFFTFLSGQSGFTGLHESLAIRIKNSALIYLGLNYPGWYIRYLVRAITQKRYTSHSVWDNIFIDMPPMNSDNKSFFENYHSSVFDSTADLAELAPLKKSSLTDQFIEKIHVEIIQKTINPLKFSGSVFLSYYSVNRALAEQVNQRLMAEGIESWLDINDLHAGEYRPEIEKKIKKCSVFFPLISNVLLDKIRIGSDNKIEEGPYSAKVEWALSINRYNAECYLDQSKFKIMPWVIDEINRTDSRIPEAFRKQQMYNLSQLDRLINDIKNYLQEPII